MSKQKFCGVCNEEIKDKVFNLMMLPVTAPAPGTGWGCMLCKLPSNGATAFVHNICLGEDIEYVRGKDGESVKMTDYEHQSFGHRYAFHVIEWRWFEGSPDTGPDCICSGCGHPIDGDDEVPLRFFSGDLEARFHQFCYLGYSNEEKETGVASVEIIKDLRIEFALMVAAASDMRKATDENRKDHFWSVLVERNLRVLHLLNTLAVEK